jgi:hypothetical protein
MAAAVSSPIHQVSTIPPEVVPDPSPAGEPPVMLATELNPTGAGTARGTAAASATEARREASTGRDGKSPPTYQLPAGTVNLNIIRSRPLLLHRCLFCFFFKRKITCSQISTYVLDTVSRHIYVCKYSFVLKNPKNAGPPLGLINN